MKDNHAWFVNMFSLFKPPNKKSREALESKQVNIGTYQLNVQPGLKEVALRLSNSLVRLCSLLILLALCAGWNFILGFHCINDIGDVAAIVWLGRLV